LCDNYNHRAKKKERLLVKSSKKNPENALSLHVTTSRTFHFETSLQTLKVSTKTTKMKLSETNSKEAE